MGIWEVGCIRSHLLDSDGRLISFMKRRGISPYRTRNDVNNKEEKLTEILVNCFLEVGALT